MRRLATLALAALAAVLLPAAPAAAGSTGCGHAVVFVLPGVTWPDVERYRPPNLLSAARHGAVASVSVRTVRSNTSYGAGFATLGAGARMESGPGAGIGMEVSRTRGLLVPRVRAGGAPELQALAQEAGYNAVPGALAAHAGHPVIAIGTSDVSAEPPTPKGYARWALLAAMDRSGIVDAAAVGPSMLKTSAGWPYGVRTDPAAFAQALDAALARPCSAVVVDPGDLERAEDLEVAAGRMLGSIRGRALYAADVLLGMVMQRLRPQDLLVAVTPTSPRAARSSHLGVMVVDGPRFEPSTELQSAVTRRPGLVTLPDVAPTVLNYYGRSVPGSMTGRPMEAVASDVHNRVSAASSLDEESVFIDTLKGPVSSVYVASQIAVYLLTVVFVMLRERRHTGLGGVPRALLEVAATVIAAFPVATYLAGAVDAHSLGLWGYVSLLAGIAAALTALVSVLLRQPLDRLLVISGFTVAVLAIDLFLGGPLEINTIFGYSPIVAGRFAGLGNVAYAVLAAASIITATLLVQRHQGSHAALAAAAGLFVLTVVVDGAPMLGSDVGGVLALVPGLGVTWMLLAGRRPTLKAVVLAGLAAVAVLGVFLVVDLSRPETQQTHLARLFDSVVRNGGSVLLETLRRKAEANLHVFTVTIWTYFFPPAMAAVLLLLARPWGRWKRFATTFPRARAGLMGGLIVGVLGFAVNDSGIVIPAVMLSFFVPAALLLHLALEDAEAVP